MTASRRRATLLCTALVALALVAAAAPSAAVRAAPAAGQAAVNARDRIGSGPWYNFKGALIARDVTDLHSESANLTKETILTEKGQPVNGRGDTPNQHDILTGTNADGMASENTCNNWTFNGEGSAAVVGHLDRRGGGPMAESWNAAHNSRGCSQDLLIASGGNGYFYCFATGQ